MDNGHSSNAQLWIKWSIVSEVRNISDLAVIQGASYVCEEKEWTLLSIRCSQSIYPREFFGLHLTQQNFVLSHLSRWDCILHFTDIIVTNSNFLDQNMLLSMKPNLDYRIGYYLLGPHQPLCESCIIQKDWYLHENFKSFPQCYIAAWHHFTHVIRWCDVISYPWDGYHIKGSPRLPLTIHCLRPHWPLTKWHMPMSNLWQYGYYCCFIMSWLVWLLYQFV